MFRVVGACLNVMHASGSDPWNDVSHEVSIDPVGDVIVHICHLEKLWNLRVFAAANNDIDVSHAPGLVSVLDDHRHSRFDVEKDRIWFGR